jgi:5-methylcytosine-specific restriction endonuclease McrA
MRIRSVSHLSDGQLAVALPAVAAQERGVTTRLLVHLAEFDDRRLYLPAGYPSMFAYCVGALHLSDDAAYKRIQAARAGRKVPAVFDALEDGRLHLTAICRLAPHLTVENSSELIVAATHRTKLEIDSFLARRFPEAFTARTQPIAILRPLPSAQLVPEPVGASLGLPTGNPLAARTPIEAASRVELVPEPVGQDIPQAISESETSAGESASNSTHSAERFLLRLPIEKGLHDRIRYAQSLLSHSIPSGDLAKVLERLVDLGIQHLEKQKFAATAKPRKNTSRSSRGRHIPAHVRRAVRKRDQERCAFVGENGHRCGATRFLEFDHVDPVARGGEATVDRVRLLCRAHNQYEAERVFGAGFMQAKRERARARPA